MEFLAAGTRTEFRMTNLLAMTVAVPAKCMTEPLPKPQPVGYNGATPTCAAPWLLTQLIFFNK